MQATRSVPQIASDWRGSPHHESRWSVFLASLMESLPRGTSLPEDLWQRRHRGILIFLWCHVPIIVLVAMLSGHSLVHGLAESSVVATIGVLAYWQSGHRRRAAGLASLGLLTSSAILVHLTDGNIETHFHFFVVIGVVTLYQDWLPFLLAIGIVLLHHGVMGMVDPRSVYNHGDAVLHPWKWAAIHGAFVVAASTACIVSWRLAEDLRAREEHARAETETLLSVTTRLDAQTEPEAVVRVLVEQSALLLEAEIVTYSTGSDELAVPGLYRNGAWTGGALPPSLESSLVGRFSGSTRSYRSNDLAVDPNRGPALGRSSDAASVLAAPVQDSDGNPLGVVAAFNSHHVGGFSERDERLLAACCSQASMALGRTRAAAARLAATARLAVEQEAVRRKEEVEALLVAASRFGSITDPEEVLVRAVEVTADLVPVHHVHIITNEGNDALSGDCRVDGACKFPEMRPSMERSSDGPAPRAMLSVPIQSSDGNVLAALNVCDRRDGAAFSDDDQRLIQGIAHYAAEALERARLTSELRRLNEDLEQRVSIRTSELAAANRELEAFSYSVSHDLRAPLRSLDGFSRILLEEHLPQLSDTAQGYLRIVRASAQQMGQLVDDLLTFSRLGRQSLKKQAVNVDALVRQVIDSLQQEQEGRCVQVRIGDLPACQADLALLRQVFANLIGNALKFTRQRESALVEIGISRDGAGSSEVVYFVKDNGAGFDMQYADKLFGVFQRLHRAEEYEGTGVGLAIVERIVQRHGGRIWAEAEVDRGATFYVALERERIDD